MPGYTHMQKAMPSSVGLWSASFVESLLDDFKLVQTAFALNNQSPLGSAASYGVSLGINREYVSDLLGFGKVQNNVLYAGNSRGKIESAILGSLAQIMLTLNKISTDLMLFTTEEFGFFQLPEEFCTGSSIMPNKKNADMLELIRAKSHSVGSCFFQVVNTIQNLPSGYNRDFQLTKKPFIEGVETTLSCIKMMNKIFKNLKVNGEKCMKALSPEIFAADKAIALVKKGVPFRDAYNAVWKNLDSDPETDTEAFLFSMKHTGAPGNLGLNKIEKQIIGHKKNTATIRTTFEQKIDKLFD